MWYEYILRTRKRCEFVTVTVDEVVNSLHGLPALTCDRNQSGVTMRDFERGIRFLYRCYKSRMIGPMCARVCVCESSRAVVLWV